MPIEPSQLPFEVLKPIFLLAHEASLESPSRIVGDGWHRYVFNPSYNKAPMSFCHVSPWWRAVASSIPELWSNLSCEQKEKRPKLAVFRHWLDLVGDNPLNLHAVSGYTSDRAIPHLLFAKKRQVQSLYIELDTHTFPAFISLQDAADTLRDLEIFKTHQNFGMSREFQINTTLKSMSNLKRLCYDQIRGPPHFPGESIYYCNIGLSRLSHVILAFDFKLDDARLMFRTCAVVESLELEMRTQSTFFYQSLGRDVTSHTLLHLTFTDAVDPFIMLYRFKLPNLKTLRAKRCEAPYSRRNFESITLFLEGSGCHLSLFEVGERDINPEDAMAYLRIVSRFSVAQAVIRSSPALRLGVLSFLANMPVEHSSPSTKLTKVYAWDGPDEWCVGWKEDADTSYDTTLIYDADSMS